MKNPTIDDKIRVSWAVNNATLELSHLTKDTGRWSKETIKDAARKYLELFDEMIRELPDEVCESCGGMAGIGTNPNPIIKGMHTKCRTEEEMYKIKQL